MYMAALLGPLNAHTVEWFAAERSQEFREKCRATLLEVEKLTLSVDEWKRANMECFGRLNYSDPNGRVVTYPYDNFCKSVTVLMKNLRGLPVAYDRISFGWAQHAIQRSATKYYHDKTWKKENMHEVIWTVLAQRPALRNYVVRILTDQFKDAEEAQFWQTCDIPANRRTMIGDTWYF
ncbi:unnamed protein product [Gongylonema pulchrum]|uniref:Uncharacterized protein n=1 Tax=Gongylonema pulchrum TaxID=637853 RepID=A0A3P6R9A1_9BILA|nr:unnamed protein product [Gongylonema pulchrum]